MRSSIDQGEMEINTKETIDRFNQYFPNADPDNSSFIPHDTITSR